MICNECKNQNIKSTVRPIATAHFLMAWQPYYDTEGNYHSHDINNNGSFFECSNGHTFHISNIPRCPTENCEWNDKVSFDQELVP